MGVQRLVDPERRFIREGILVKMCRRSPKLRYFFLFSDVLLYCSANETEKDNTKPTYIFHRSFDVKQVRVEDIPESEGMENAFQLLSNQKSFAVFAESAESKKKWISDINMARNYGKEPDTPSEGEDIAPVWVPDKLVKNCMQCKSKFTAINRRVSVSLEMD
jgi:hypothetical protein